MVFCPGCGESKDLHQEVVIKRKDNGEVLREGWLCPDGFFREPEDTFPIEQ